MPKGAVDRRVWVGDIPHHLALRTLAAEEERGKSASQDADEESVRKAMSAFGEVDEVQLRLKGAGQASWSFVIMKNPQAARKAVAAGVLTVGKHALKLEPVAQKVQFDDAEASQSVAGLQEDAVKRQAFVNSRGYKKRGFLKVDWKEELKDHNLGPTYGLDPRKARHVAAGRRAKRLPLSSRERLRQGPRDQDDDAGSSAGDNDHVLETVDALTLLDPSIQLTMPGLKPEENAQLRERVLEKIDAQVVQIQQRLIRRRDKMDALGFLDQDSNQARVEAMLKLEIRKRIRIDEVKDVVLSEMWQEKAKLVTSQAQSPPQYDSRGFIERLLGVAGAARGPVCEPGGEVAQHPGRGRLGRDRHDAGLTQREGGREHAEIQGELDRGRWWGRAELCGGGAVEQCVPSEGRSKRAAADAEA